MAGKRFDSLVPETDIVVRFGREFQFDGPEDEDATFVKIEGTGNDRRMTLRQAGMGEWEAYRYNGRWVYGSSAESLRLISVKE